MLGLEEGDAHVIRNAGGVVTEDEIRSLSISQRLLGTEEIILIHHTDCGMLTFTDDEFKRSIQDETGIKPSWSAEAFGDLDEDVRQSIARIKASPFIPRKESVRGFVFEVETGRLREVAAERDRGALRARGVRRSGPLNQGGSARRSRAAVRAVGADPLRDLRARHLGRRAAGHEPDVAGLEPQLRRVVRADERASAARSTPRARSCRARSRR